MITLADIERLIVENDPEVKAEILLYENIIQANESSLELEAVYMCETAKEKLSTLLYQQSRQTQYILLDSVTKSEASYKKREHIRQATKEIKEMEAYAGYSDDEREHLKALKRFVFVGNQDLLVANFLIEQFKKRDEYFASLQECTNVD
jgi:hypothetical protein